MASHEGLSILDALENLNALVEVDSLSDIEVTENAQLISHKMRGEEDSYWVAAGADEMTIDAIRETFRTVHRYVQSFYKKMHESGDSKQMVEGINTIMVLVGEAAKKLDHFGTLFREKVTEFDEYKKLQDFYRKRVMRGAFRDFAKKAVPKETLEEEVEEVGGVHILNDVDVVKRDHLYELFYLKNEAGHPFFTYELGRNLKLACDFGEFAEEYFGEDPLLQIKNWEDKALHQFAKKLLDKSKKRVAAFYKEALAYREVGLVNALSKALMALMLAANPRNLIRQFAVKGCHLYFHDFQLFLREALSSREYQKFLIYAPSDAHPLFVTAFELASELAYNLFACGVEHEELKQAFEQQGGKGVSEVVGKARASLEERLKSHPSGPVFKALDLVREEEREPFDPLLQGNLPEKDGSLQWGEQEVHFMRMPSPVAQEFINRATITDEFRAFLRVLKERGEGPLLVVNFQDRTSWREFARSSALEEMGRQAEFVDVVHVITLSKDTDFYTQTGLYRDLDDVEAFVGQLYEHLSDESAGSYMVRGIRQALFPDFGKGLLQKIHQTFFGAAKRLSVEERLDFIELAYLFVVLKVIEVTGARLVTLTSKDGLDTGGASHVELLTLLGVGEDKKWSEEELQTLNILLFGATLLARERAVQPEQLDRLCHVAALLEAHDGFAKAFDGLFAEPIERSVLRL